MSTFYALHPRLREAIVRTLGWASLRPVQELAGEALLAGKNAVVLAPTAGGKTEASIFPTLSTLLTAAVEGVGAIYIAPIKALLNNQADRLGHYTEMVGLRRFVWHGDTSASEKRRFVQDPTELLMTTPESLEVMLASARVPAPALFADLRVVILDEVHALAGTDRGAHLMAVLERVAALSRHDVQRVGLSATIGNPDAILRWIGGSSAREGVVVDPPRQPARRELAVWYADDGLTLADEAAKAARGRKSLFFCQSRAVTESVAERMRASGTAVFVHHSSVSHEERAEAERRFHHGRDTCIACTSTLELGIDVGDLDRVLQLDAPSTVSAFLQRMGRTGRRAGTVANMTFFCSEPEAVLQALALIHLARRGWVEAVPVVTRCWPVLVHQTLALCLAHGSVTPDRVWDLTRRVPDLRGISRAELDAVLRHMEAERYLFLSGGLLAMGDRAERVFGRKNFMELYAVFSTPQLYRVQTREHRELGSLEQAFVDRLAEDASSFLLAGRAWLVEHINHQDRTIRVAPAPRGTKPSWGGMTPSFLSYEVCQAMREVLVSEEPAPAASGDAAAVLTAWRDDLGALLRDEPAGLFERDDGLIWWTFAGGRINTTLKYAIEALTGWKVVTDNLSVQVRTDDTRPADLSAVIHQLADRAVWEGGLEDVVRERIPEYRLSKFQRALPAWAARELLETYILDVGGARRAAGEALTPAHTS